MPRSAIIWTRSRELSLNVRYHRTHRTIISWSKCRPLKGSCAEAGSVIQAVTAGSRAFQVCTRTAKKSLQTKALPGIAHHGQPAVVKCTGQLEFFNGHAGFTA